jgi:signal transduction histidine kinase
MLYVIFLLGFMFFTGIVSTWLSYSLNKPVRPISSSTNEIIPTIFDQNLQERLDEFHMLKERIVKMRYSTDGTKNDSENKKNVPYDVLSVFKHELLTPLVPISGHAQMLSDAGFLGHLNKSQLESVEEIYINVRKLEGVINKVLELQVLEKHLIKFSPNKMDARNTLESLLSEIKLDKNNESEIINLIPNKLCVVTDEACLKRVLTYLLDNSADFVPAGKGRIEVGAYPKDSNVIWYVRDNGIGIPVDKQGNIFKKFYQTDTSVSRKHGGTGLGLAICKGIVEGQGGKIWFESKQGENTTFYFSLPTPHE